MNALQIMWLSILGICLACILVYLLAALIYYLQYLFWKHKLKRKYKRLEKRFKQANYVIPTNLKRAIIRFKYFKELSEITGKPITDYDKSLIQISPTTYSSKNYFEELSEDDKKLAFKATQQILEALKLEKEDSNNDTTNSDSNTNSK